MSKHIDKLYGFVSATALVVFCLFVWAYESHERETAREQMLTHARLLSDALWNYNEAGAAEYLELACQSHTYRSLAVLDIDGTVFESSTSAAPGGVTKQLMRLGLIPESELSANVYYDQRVIGQVRAVWLNTAIYGHTLVLVLLILLVTIVRLYASILIAKRDLELRVRERTAQLSEREEHLRITLNSIGDAVITTDDKSGVVTLNPVAEELLGLVQSDSIGEDLSDLVEVSYSGDRSILTTILTRVVDGGETVTLLGHGQLTSTAGEIRQVTVNGAPIRDVDGTILGAVLVFRDVTEEAAAQLAREVSERRLRDIADKIPGMVFQVVVEPEYYFRVTYIGGAVDNVLGLDSKLDGFFERFTQGLAADDIDAFQQSTSEAIDNRAPWEFEGRFVRPDGRVVWFQGMATPSEIDGNLVYNGLLLDITQRREAEQALVTSEKRFRTVFENSPQAMFIVDAKTQEFIDVNPAAEIHAQCSRQEMIGSTPVKLGLTTEATSRQIQDCLTRDGQISAMPIRGYSRDGRERDLLFSGVEAVLDGRRCAVVIVTDVTEQRKLEEQLRQTWKMDSIGQLAGGVAHDFNNMLGGIIGAAELLAMTLSGNEEVREYVNMIINTAERAAELTGKLLSFSRKGPVVAASMDIHETIQESLAILERSIDRRIDLQTHLHADVSTLHGDATSLQNIVLNLGVNARDAMPDGGTLNVTTENVEFDEAYCARSPFDIAPGLHIHLSIMDTGCGMTADVQRRIFEPFYTTKLVGKGTGLGLAAVYGAVKDHRGAITVYSEPGRGTVFHLYFPVDPTAVVGPSVEVGEDQRGTGCVLVVDDEEVIRTTAAHILENLGYEVMLAENGEQGVAQYAKHQHRIDVVILDMVMPRMNGQDCFRAILAI
ncbi:MAG: PAS domain S-box protein, partial [candidate division Zixibacteria bacterium]|nr:PAS domain S-box protein [candidate division Zixibacteria bacterium]